MLTTLTARKRLILFDLDGTLCVSKTPLDSEMFGLLKDLLVKYPVAILSGGSFKLFQTQLERLLKGPKKYIEKLYLFPTCGSVFYRYQRGWTEQYAELLTNQERKKIFASFASAFRDIKYAHPEKLFGEVIEDRRTQVSFSALGQKAPVALKKKWARDNPEARSNIKNALGRYIPEFEIRFGGMTTIDVTRKGIDKAYGIEKIEKIFHITKSHMFFVGDDLGPDGNDYPVKRTGVDCEAVTGPEDTKRIIRRLLD